MPSELSYPVQQTPINGTISVMVQPGNVTGRYYIPIANLPWQTSWQELKDHVRTVCLVEHVEINEDSTSGHVVLKGRANFDAAFRLLNGGIFHDRALIADGRNVDACVWIKHHVDAPASSPQSSTNSRYTGSSAQTVSPATTPSSGYGEWPAASTSSSYMVVPVMNPSYSVPCTMSDYADSTAIYNLGGYTHGYSGAMMTSGLPCLSGPDYAQQYTPIEHYGNGYGIATGDIASLEGRHCNGQSPPSDAVTTKKRKIIIRQLHPWTNETQIGELIRRKAGSDASKLQKLDVPLADGQQGMNRGYALATFETEEAADKVIRRLNNYQYEGRILEAKHTKEGVSDHQSSHASRSTHQRHSHHTHHSRREYHDEKDRKGKDKDKESSHKSTSHGEKKVKSSSSKSDVVIAHGSSYSYA
ncbi:hypothetical protein GGR50DRAFT_706928 [Xylaria sp. CBS 124048]|nr:hypothetical protein GGR50DRAFT_706928 [Xylaria sp. CBS 124048]